MINRKKLMRLLHVMSSFSIKIKIFGMVLFIILLITGITLIVVRYSITNTLNGQIEDRAKSISTDIASRSIDLFLTNNIYGLQSLITDTLENYTDIEYIFILNKNNEVMIQSNPEKPISDELKNVNKVEINNNQFMTHTRLIQSDVGPILDASSPVLQEGTVRVGLTYVSLYDALYRITKQLLYIMIGTLVLAIIIVYILTKIITYPITKLVFLTDEVSQGNLSQRISFIPNDEIGKLTSSFNHMLDHLENSESIQKKFLNTIQNRNKELLLLNELSITSVTSFEQVRTLLQEFVTHLVKELSLNSATLTVEISGNEETFHFTLIDCDHYCFQDRITDKSHCACGQLNRAIFNMFPLVINNRRIGTIRICSQDNLNEYLVHILHSITSQISMLLENVHLWHELKVKEEIRVRLLEKVISVQEDERKRIARELHDETSHSLSSILLGLKIIQESKTDQERTLQLDQLRNLTQQTMKEVHNLAWQLRPTILDKFGLSVALERYIEEFQENSNHKIDVDLVIKGLDNERLNSEVETAIFRVIQEALTNVAKYAKASFVSVILIANKHQISIVIEDDGIGFEAERVLSKTPSQNNLGLHGMMERINLLGGTLDIESVPEKGTTIFAKIPMMKEKVCKG